LKLSPDIDLLRETIRRVKEIYCFKLMGYVFLPDHIHLLLKMESDGNFSKVMHSLKRNYTLNYKEAHSLGKTHLIWQRGFWDRIIRDETDLGRHFDYIHWNPVKHGYVACPEDWPQSSYLYWAERGYYPQDWGRDVEPANIKGMDPE
jgi:putative transposase